MKRKYRHILDTSRALKFQASLPTKFCGESAKTAIYVINRLPTELLEGKTPFEMLHNKSPSLSHLKVFGCLCYATNLVKEDKFAPWARASVFLEYSETQKGYKLMDISTKCFFVCRDVMFKEYLFPFTQVPTKSVPAKAPFLVPDKGRVITYPYE